jgi:hypothetical protein
MWKLKSENWLHAETENQKRTTDHFFSTLNSLEKYMIQSMTGFVKQLFNYQPKKITEVKSLNSKV